MNNTHTIVLIPKFTQIFQDALLANNISFVSESYKSSDDSIVGYSITFQTKDINDAICQLIAQIFINELSKTINY